MQKVKITFLGTGPSGRIPRPGCTRPSCQDARRNGSRSRRLQQSLLMRSGKHTLLFDVSRDLLKQWKNARLSRRPDAVFISHPHGDAMGGVHLLPRLFGRRPLIPVFAEPLTWEHIRGFHAANDFAREFHLKTGRTEQTGPFSVTPFRVEHTFLREHPTVGFSIKRGNTHIVLMTDVKRVAPRILARLSRPDLLIMDCAIYEDEMPYHVNFAQARELIARLKPRRAILTQIGVSWPPYEEARRIAAHAGIGMAYDGLRVQL